MVVIQKTERFEMRLDPDTLEKLDAWRNARDDVPSRAEAIRRLVNAALASSATNKTPAFSDGEKLILTMLCGVHKKLGVKDGYEPEFIQSAITGGHYWGLGWDYTGVFHGHADSDTVVKEVVDILEMWSLIELSYVKLPSAAKNKLQKEENISGEDIKFSGFDGNNESEHIGIARFLIEEMGRFASLKNHELNSHYPSLSSHRRMLKIFAAMRSNLVGRYLSVEQITALLRAQAYQA